MSAHRKLDRIVLDRATVDLL